MPNQYLRRVQLTVSDAFEAMDLSELHIRFETRQADIQTPNRATIRIYNLAEATAQKVQKEFTKVTLQAGYQDGAFGVIFDGTIVQVRKGRENATDTYLDLICGDGDEALNFSTVSTVISSGSTFKDRVDALQKAMADKGVKPGFTGEPVNPETLPRGKVFWGMCRDHLRVQAASQGMSYSVQNGELTMIPLQGYKPGEAVVINSQTGMVGLPEQTQDGIRVVTLLNPALAVGSTIQINESSVQQQLISQNLTSDASQNNFPGIASDGLYKVMVIEYVGDTRGTPWYSNIIALGIDPSTNSLSSGLYAKGQG
jgi:hypothetical protein